MRRPPTLRDDWYPAGRSYWWHCFPLGRPSLDGHSSRDDCCCVRPYSAHRFDQFDSRSFCCSNCHSNSWFHWVSRSTVVARVCTCLSNALDGFSVSWLVVAINHVWTIQLFVFEMVIWLITHSHGWLQLMMQKNRQWVDHPHICQ